MEESILVTGAVVRVLETKVSGPNDFKSRAVHVKTDGQYPQTMEVQFNQGNVSLLDGLLPAQKVNITMNLKGREYIKEGNPIVFNSLIGWKIEKLV
jgi:single-strand DNA-binding protein